VISDVVMGLQPNPLLPFGEESVVAGLSFAVLHHCTETKRKHDTHCLKKIRRITKVHSQCSWHLASVSRSST